MISKDVESRFFKMVEPMMDDQGCWEWTGALIRGRYGNFGFGANSTVSAHRMSWIIANGEVPKQFPALHVCHKCDNTTCVNPAHLFLGTAQDNHSDSVAKGRHAHGERMGTARLTNVMVLAIREAYATGKYTYPELGALYDVSACHVGGIIRRRSWRHL